MSTISNAIYGFTIGDAFGVPVEFLERDTYKVEEMIGYGSWDVPAGTWSDDSAMMFITMEHLLDGGSLDQLKQAFCDWAHRGYWTYNDEPAFDVGITIREVINRWERNGLHEKAKTDEFSNGNGALMRILPVALWTHAKRLQGEELFLFVKGYAELTHGHIRSTLCCYHYTVVVHQLLEGSTLAESMRHANEALDDMLKQFPDETPHFERLHTIGELPRNEIASSGYVIDTLEAVYWSLLNSRDYYEAIHTAVHLGKDTDTIGALTGGLAGLFYDELNVPERWFGMLPKGPEIQALIGRFEQALKQ
ncbi:MAG: ADP-ribosylglycohydrolase family protein [Lysinibacillus sp.]